MIVGIGIDLIELKRIEAAFARQPRFPGRVLTSYEQEQMAQLAPNRQIEYLAGRFAAKEAFAKAKGTGIGAGLSWHDIEIRTEGSGKPYIVVNDDSARVHLSITHSKEYAAAQVVIET
ncbi:4'-phosphopantetheinyl transferase [Niallia circulans]|jgi:holo-[acyl-carrier protein] synthase|uniref:holo-ACP synthase n=1 Tax=Shouchella clausii TaxID=79880 RepID=UPI000B961407|nr:holo-ACP synthase [Shouchella clausii]SPU21196.1 4'-phosphopantetheinyl transferase [Niallia circulans]AST94876.1 holo-ACP synthase [Shouchella clausii]MCR1290011.1 holo-ACP synthase [Shouchella clausii]MCY1106343.1 holo-ACP synthase [Shouchella clausii]MEB5473354.1 holo-ACP synthase [Shouchella clausii]